MNYLFRIVISGLTMMGLMLSTAYPAAITRPTQVVNGFNAFAFDLYKAVDKAEENKILSPYSLTALLGLLAQAAEGETYAQLMTLMHFDKDEEAEVFLSALNKIDNALQAGPACGNWLACRWMAWFGSKEKPRTFVTASAFWADNSFSYQPAFLSLIQKDKRVVFDRVNFMKAPEQAREKINRWVEKNTQNHIKELIPPAAVNTATRIVLTNAIYFKGAWTQAFKREQTKPALFTLLNGEKISAPMMHQKDKFFYAENDELQMLQLPYKDSKLAMLILLPKENASLQAVEKNLNADSFTQLLQESYKQEMLVSVPKFTAQSTFNGLDKSLQAMGWTDAFNDKANFSKLTKEPLRISDIIQKAMIQVDEEGTVVAAATASIIETTAYMPAISFEVNRPFLFMIYDTDSKLILFLGQIVDPRYLK